MKCLQATKVISDAKERELAISEKLALKAHLLICPHCRNFKHNCDEISNMMKKFAKEID